MKILYIGHYREGTGWAQAAIDYILSLDKVGLDVVCRPIKLNNSRPDIPFRIQELENKDLDGVTHVIQHVLPHFMDVNTSFKNIAIFAGETNGFGITGWPCHLELFDEVWVPNTELVQACQNELRNPKVLIRNIPHATNIKKFKKEYEPLDIPELDGKFVFYFVGEFIRRKHVSALFRAFHAEFEAEENVGLLLKVNKSGYSPEDVLEMCKENSRLCKEQLRKYKNPEYYHNEIFICHRLSETDLHRLHKSCHCFVNPSFGEAWSIPTFDAMAHGNLVVSSNTGGMKDFLHGPGFLVNGETEHCFGADPPFDDLHTANEDWFNISISDLQRNMRKAFELSDAERLVRQNWGIRQSLEYSYEKIGQKMKEALYAT